MSDNIICNDCISRIIYVQAKIIKKDHWNQHLVIGPELVLTLLVWPFFNTPSFVLLVGRGTVMVCLIDNDQIKVVPGECLGKICIRQLLDVWDDHISLGGNINLSEQGERSEIDRRLIGNSNCQLIRSRTIVVDIPYTCLPAISFDFGIWWEDRPCRQAFLAGQHLLF